MHPMTAATSPPVRSSTRTSLRRLPAATGRATLVVALAAAVLSVAAGAADARGSLGTFQTSVEIEAGEEGSGRSTMEVVVEAEEPAVVTVGFADVILGEDLSWQPVEFGSTPYSLAGRVRTVPEELVYDGADVGERRVFEVDLIVDDVEEDAHPLAGLLTYSLAVGDAAGEGLAVREGVGTRIRLGAWPQEYTGVPAELDLEGLALRPVEDEVGGLDALLPDLPRVLNRGPAEAEVRTRNVGDALVQSETTVVIARRSWWSLLPFTADDAVDLITYVDRQRLLLPGEFRTSRVASTVDLDETVQIDRLPTFGPVRVSAEATGFLGDSRSTVTTSATYLVAPWKEALVILLLLLGLSWARRRFTRWRSGHDQPAPEDGHGHGHKDDTEVEHSEPAHTVSAAGPDPDPR